MLDDATSEIYYAQLVEAECTRSIMAAIREVIETKGLFCSMYSDRAGHFFVTPKRGERVDPSRPTQVGRALQELGIKMIPAYSPQARGRSERNFGTWQGRLPQELRLRGITGIEEANEFLCTEYIAEFNNRFAVPAAQKGTAFVRIRRKDLDWVFSAQHERTVNNDNTVAFENRMFQLDKTRWRNTLAGQTIVVHEHIDGRISIRYGPHVIAQYAIGDRPKFTDRIRLTGTAGNFLNRNMNMNGPSKLVNRIFRLAGCTLALVSMHSIQAETQDNTPSVVIQWNSASLQGVRNSKLGPPMVARALAIVHTCIYDAWAAYDDRALGTRLGGSLRQPPEKRSRANEKSAISFAAYRAAVDLFPADKARVFDPLMTSLGYNPNDTSTDTATPSGIGNVACAAVLRFRHDDGANQLGTLSPSGVPYADYTGFTPSNPPATVPVDWATVTDVNHWQPLQYVDATGTLVTQTFVAPQWNRVIPFALTSSSQFRSVLERSGPALFGSDEFLKQAQALVGLSASLTDTQKMMAEYWADGPHSELPPGHWNLFAQFVSARDHHDVAADVKMFFALTNAILDGGIVAWDAKRASDSVRPVTAIPFLFHGQQIRSWGGPYAGTRIIDGGNWVPYQANTFPTPPFPEFISGHSTFSAAGAEILKLLTHSDSFGYSVTLPAGSSKIEPGLTPAQAITLTWPTFTDAADEAGLSRRYGGIHFAAADLAGKAVGRLIARQALVKARTLWGDHGLKDPDLD